MPKRTQAKPERTPTSYGGCAVKECCINGHYTSRYDWMAIITHACPIHAVRSPIPAGSCLLIHVRRVPTCRHRYKLYLYMPTLYADVVNYRCSSNQKMSYHNGCLIVSFTILTLLVLVARGTAGEVSTCRFSQLPVIFDGTASRLLAYYQIRSIRHHRELSRSLQCLRCDLWSFPPIAYIKLHIDARVSSTEPSQPFIDTSQTCCPIQAVALPGAYPMFAILYHEPRHDSYHCA